MRIGRAKHAAAAFAVAVTLGFSGCIASAVGPGPDPGSAGFTFEWSAGPGDHGYYLELVAGPTTSCVAREQQSGSFTHPAGIGGFSWMSSPAWGWLSVALRQDHQSVHAGPVNSAHVTGPILAQMGNQVYGGNGVVTIGPGELLSLLGATFAAHADGQNLQIACDGTAALRFHLADALEPVKSSTATGGAGATLGHLVGVNAADAYRIRTAGDHVFLYLFEREAPSQEGPDPYLNGQVTVSWPSGMETVPLQPDRHGDFRLLRAWDEAGQYSLGLDRIAVSRSQMYGLLAGFSLTEEVGDQLLFA